VQMGLKNHSDEINYSLIYLTSIEDSKLHILNNHHSLIDAHCCHRMMQAKILGVAVPKQHIRIM